MAAEVLCSHDSPSKPPWNCNSNLNNSRRKRVSMGFKDKEDRENLYPLCEISTAKLRARNMKMGEVKILKRGENLKPSKTDAMKSGLLEIKATEYYFAGSYFGTSPLPSCLPVPGFIMKKAVEV